MEKEQASGGRDRMESQKTKRVVLYRRDDVRRLIDQLLKGSGGIEPRRDPNAGDYAFDEMAGLKLSVLLKELAAGGVLDEYRIDSVPVCPKCEHSNFFLNYSCPFCQHHNLDRATMIEHYGCGHTDFESNFKSGRDLVCPKCSRELKLIGSDFRKIDRVYHCSSCTRDFGTPNVQLSCRKCEAVFLLDDAHTVPILGYRLNEKLRGELVAHCALEAPIVDVLRGLDYEVETAFVERGVSGIDHTFDIYAHNGHSDIVLDIASGTQEVGQESVFALFSKKYDTKHHRAMLVAVPRLSREAQQLSANFKIEVVDGASLEELVGHLKELATIAQMDLPGPADMNGNRLGTTPLAGPSQLDPSVVEAEASMLSLRKQRVVLLQRASAEEMLVDRRDALSGQQLIKDCSGAIMHPSHSEEADVRTEAASPGIPFERGLLEAVDESLLVFMGESGAAAIYFHIEGISSLKRSEIPRRLKEFSLAIATIFRAGAPVVEQSILRTLCEKLGMDCEGIKDMEFQTAIETVRQRLPMHM